MKAIKRVLWAGLAAAGLCSCDGKLEVFASGHGIGHESSSYSEKVSWGKGGQQGTDETVKASGGEVSAVVSGPGAQEQGAFVKVSASGIEKSMPLPAVARWETGLPFAVEQKCGEPGKYVLTADEKLLGLIDEGQLKDGKLRLRPGRWLMSGFAKPVVIQTPPLESFVAAGVSSARLGCASAKKVGLDVAGTASLALDGVSSDEVQARQAGASSLEIGPGRIGYLDLDSSGAGSVVVQAKVDRLEVDSSGVSSVEASSAGRVSVDASGSGSVKVLSAGRVEKASVAGVASVEINGKEVGSDD